MFSDKSDSGSSSSYGYEPNYFNNKKDSGDSDEEDDEDDDYEFGQKIDGERSKGNSHKVRRKYRSGLKFLPVPAWLLLSKTDQSVGAKELSKYNPAQ